MDQIKQLDNLMSAFAQYDSKVDKLNVNVVVERDDNNLIISVCELIKGVPEALEEENPEIHNVFWENRDEGIWIGDELVPPAKIYTAYDQVLTLANSLAESYKLVARELGGIADEN